MLGANTSIVTVPYKCNGLAWWPTTHALQVNTKHQACQRGNPGLQACRTKQAVMAKEARPDQELLAAREGARHRRRRCPRCFPRGQPHPPQTLCWLPLHAGAHACKLCLSHMDDGLAAGLCLPFIGAVMPMACQELPQCRVGGGYEYVSPGDRSSLLMEHSTYTTYRSLPANPEPYSDYDLVSIAPAVAALL